MAPLTAAGTGASPPLAGDAAPVEAAAARLGLSVPPPHAALSAAAPTATGARRARRMGRPGGPRPRPPARGAAGDCRTVGCGGRCAWIRPLPRALRAVGRGG